MLFYGISAEARGKRRMWCEATKARARRLSALLASREFQRAVNEYARPSGHHRTRAKLTMERLLRDLAWPAIWGQRGRFPLACYATIEPNQEALYSLTENELDPDLVEGASIGYLLLGRVNATDIVRSSGWTLIVTAHALGRLFERQPQADPDATMLDAHAALMQVRDVEGLMQASTVLPTRGGGFVCTVKGTQAASGARMLSLDAHTWVNDGLLHHDQMARYLRLCAGGLDQRAWLLPEPLRTVQLNLDGTWSCDLTEYAIQALG